MLVDKMFGLRFHEGDIGLELEVEGKNQLPVIENRMWVTKGEGSLRGHAAEYVTIGNLWNNPDKTKEINYLINSLPVSSINQRSPRTSLHVHVNVQKYTVEQVYTVMCAYWLVENLLIKFCDAELREGNHFCLRLADAEYILKAMVKDLKNNIPFACFQHGRSSMRYGALNLAAVPKFGSVEFRSMRGTLDPKLIDLWSSQLQRMCASAKKKYKSPSDLLDAYFGMNKSEFLASLFSRPFVQELIASRGWRELMEENEGTVCELAYAKDWAKSIKTEFLQKKPKPTAWLADGRLRPQRRPPQVARWGIDGPEFGPAALPEAAHWPNPNMVRARERAVLLDNAVRQLEEAQPVVDIARVINPAFDDWEPLGDF